MRNKLKLLFASVFLMSPQLIFASEYIVCGNERQIPKIIGDIFSTLMTVIRIIVPILLVIIGMISFLKVAMSGNTDDDLKKAQNKLISNVISAVIIFFIVSIINFVIGLAAGSNNSVMSCIKCLVNSNGCQILESTEKICPGMIGQEYNGDCGLKDNPYKQEKEEDINKGNYVDSNTTTPSITPSTTPINQVQTCCTGGGGTYNNGTCENITNQSAYDACINSGVVDVPDDNENTDAENVSYDNCCIRAGGIYNNGKCESMTNQNAYNACINSIIPKVDEVVKTQCCLKSGGKYDEGTCKEYTVSSSQFTAYNACVGLGKDKEECCKNNTDGKYQNGKCISAKFKENTYRRCVARSK